MGSESHATRINQLEATQKQLDARLEALNARGLEEKAIERDSIVRHLRSDLLKCKKRVAAAVARGKLDAEIAERTAKKKAAAAKGGDKKKGKKKDDKDDKDDKKAKKKKAENKKKD